MGPFDSNKGIATNQLDAILNEKGLKVTDRNPGMVSACGQVESKAG